MRLSIALALVAGAAVASASDPPRIAVRLVPEAKWSGQPDPRVALPDGTVHLFAAGAFTPAVTTAANVPFAVPKGLWMWMAEAPGFVSVMTGAMRLEGASSPSEGREVRQFYVPVVPACRVILAESAVWSSTQRVDVVSLDRAAVYPIVLAHRRDHWVPAGRFLYYTVGRQGAVTAISSPQSCSAGESRALVPPSEPALDRAGLLASFVVPASLDPREVSLTLEGKGGALPPTAMVRFVDSVTAFFVDVPAAAGTRFLRSRHPGAVSTSVEVRFSGGTIAELPTQELRLRPVVEITVEYRPKVKHLREDLWLAHLTLAQRQQRRWDWSIAKNIQQQRLRPGVHTYRFTDLDSGRYMLMAQVDDIELRGGGAAVAFSIEGDEPFPGPLHVEIEERGIHGHLLLDEQPVPGEIRLPVSVLGQTANGPMRVARTGPDLFYRLTYFVARKTESNAELPSLRPLRTGLAVACADDGPCRPLGRDARISGEGRVDIHVDAGRQVRLTIVDAETSAPVAGAKLTVGHGMSSLVVEETGEVRWEADEEERPGVSVHTSDLNGQASIRISRERGGHVDVRHSSYRKAFVELEPRAADEVRIELEPVGRAPSAQLLVRGRPLARAAVMVAREGRFDLDCTEVTDAQGRFETREECISGARLLVLDRRVSLHQAIWGQDALGSSVIELDPAPPLPVRVEVVDEAGTPVVSLPIVVDLDGLRIDQRTVGVANSSAGQINFVPWSDRDGQLEIWGLDPNRGFSIRSDDARWEGSLTSPATTDGQAVQLTVSKRGAS